MKCGCGCRFRVRFRCPCYCLLCLAVPCCALLYFAVVFCTLLRLAVACCGLLWLSVAFCALSCLAVPCRALPWLSVPCRALLCLAVAFCGLLAECSRGILGSATRSTRTRHTLTASCGAALRLPRLPCTQTPRHGRQRPMRPRQRPHYGPAVGRTARLHFLLAVQVASPRVQQIMASPATPPCRPTARCSLYKTGQQYARLQHLLSASCVHVILVGGLGWGGGGGGDVGGK